MQAAGRRKKGRRGFDEKVITAIQAEIIRDSEQSATSIATAVYRKTGVRLSPSRMGAIRGGSKSYKSLLKKRARMLKKDRTS